MFCVKCGKEIDETKKFCTGCGTPVSETIEALKQKETNGSGANSSKAGGSGKKAHTPQKQKSAAPIIIAVVLILILIIAAALFFFVVKPKLSDKKDEVKTESVSKSEAEEIEAEQEEVKVISPEEAESAMLEIAKDIDDYIFNVIYNAVYNGEFYYTGDTISKRMTESEASFAAARIGYSESDSFDLSGDYTDYQGFTINQDKLNRICEKYFGKEFDSSSFKEWGKNELIDAFDVVMYEGEVTPIDTYYLHIYSWIVEDKDYTVMADAENYELTIDGYFGDSQYNPYGQLRNLVVKLTFEADSESEYGLVLNKLEVEKTADETTMDPLEGEDAGDPDGEESMATADVEPAFYGLWVYADKDVNNANSVANELIKVGIDARVYLTSDWSNLNPDPYYAVTAGVYETEYDANMMLTIANDAGYDAYVKYSGEHN